MALMPRSKVPNSPPDTSGTRRVSWPRRKLRTARVSRNTGTTMSRLVLSARK